MVKYFLKSISDIQTTANSICEDIKKNGLWIIAVDGEMGSGKTTLIKEICKHLNVISTVNSPTFSIINEYITINNEIIFHFDCYRIESEKEAIEIGIPEYLDSGNKCFIEWHENICTLLPAKFLKVKIIVQKNGERTIEVNIENIY